MSPKRRDLESAAADSTKSYWNTPPFPVPHHDILKPDVMLATRCTAVNADHQADFDVGETVEQVSRDGSGGRYAVLAVGKAILCSRCRFWIQVQGLRAFSRRRLWQQHT